MTVSTLKWFDRFSSSKEPAALHVAVRAAISRIGHLAVSAFVSVPSAGAAADELFERAAAYEATQPGYAADLRAAACKAQSRHFGGG
jgi:hypothetical protein